MRIAHFRLCFVLALAAGAALADTARADSSVSTETSETVVVVGTRQYAVACGEAAPDRARAIAVDAVRDGDFRRAGACYLIAGDKALADQAFIKAVSQTHAETSRTFAASTLKVKAQARQWKEAFRRW